MGKSQRRNQTIGDAGAEQGPQGEGAKANTGENSGEQSNQQQQQQQQGSNKNKGDILLGVYLHCQECTNKLVKALLNFEGVEDVKADCKQHRVTVKGKKVDPKKVAERVKRECNSKQVVIISPKLDNKNANKAGSGTPDVKKESKEFKEVTVVLKMYIHCDNCGKEIKKSILGMKGVKTVEINIKNSQVTVKGNVQPEKVVKYIENKMGKQASIAKTEKQQNSTNQKENNNGDHNHGGRDRVNAVAAPLYPPAEYADLIYASEMFNDENALACIIM
ncbi:hypothetical protein Dimus_015316 [Dionaea muscipula]